MKHTQASWKQRKHSILISAMGVLMALSSTLAWAQPELLHTKDFTPLRASAANDSAVLGMFDATASVELLGAAQGGWQMVRADNGAQGYVRSSELTAHPMGVPPERALEPFSPASSTYGSAHMYIIAAGLKARIAPNSSKVACILHMGDSVSVNYVPIAPDEWVKLESGCATSAESAYVMRKFLGKQPDIQALFAQYDALASSDLLNRRTLAERAVELSWNLDNHYRHVKPALSRFLSVAQDLGDAQMIENTQISLLVADSLASEIPQEDHYKQLETMKFQAVVGNMTGKSIKISQLKQNLGEPSKIKRIENDECGVYAGTHFYEYPHARFDTDVKGGNAYLIQMDFAGEGNAFLFKNQRFDKNTTERAFLIQTKGWIDAQPNDGSHSYSIYGDAEFYNFTFRNGLLAQYNYYSTC